MHFYQKNKKGESSFGAHKNWNGNITLIFPYATSSAVIASCWIHGHAYAHTKCVLYASTPFSVHNHEIWFEFFWLKFENVDGWNCLVVFCHTNVHASIISHSSETMNINTYTYSINSDPNSLATKQQHTKSSSSSSSSSLWSLLSMAHELKPIVSCFTFCCCCYFETENSQFVC